MLDQLSAGDDNRRARRFYLSLMGRMGVQLDHFVDSDQFLEKIWDARSPLRVWRTPAPPTGTPLLPDATPLASLRPRHWR